MKNEIKEIFDKIKTLNSNERMRIVKMILADLDLDELKPIEPSRKRTYGEYIGKIKISEDFDEPLPDAFWTEETDETVD